MCSSNTQVINVVETEVHAKLTALESFTALDVSNALKQARYPIRHREVAEVVRDLYACGAIPSYGYRRELISVMADGGAQHAQTWLYLPQNACSQDYMTRQQEALTPVPTTQARDLSDCVAAGPLGLLQRMTQRIATGTGYGRSRNGRRDGALSLSRQILSQLGWTDGDTLTVEAAPGEITIKPQNSPHSSGILTVRVWSGQRVRLSKTKLRLGALSSDIVTVEVVGDSVRVVPKSTPAISPADTE